MNEHFSALSLLLCLKLGLHIVVTIAEHACDHVLKRVLKLSRYLLQIFLVKCEYLRSLRLCEDQGIREKLEKRVLQHVLAIFTTYMGTGPGDIVITINNPAMMIIFSAL